MKDPHMNGLRAVRRFKTSPEYDRAVAEAAAYARESSPDGSAALPSSGVSLRFVSLAVTSGVVAWLSIALLLRAYGATLSLEERLRSRIESVSHR